MSMLSAPDSTQPLHRLCSDARMPQRRRRHHPIDLPQNLTFGFAASPTGDGLRPAVAARNEMADGKRADDRESHDKRAWCAIGLLMVVVAACLPIPSMHSTRSKPTIFGAIDGR